MADYVAVLKKTIDGLGETTPEIRKKVYEKARATISKKLMAIDPPPAKDVFDRQMQALDEAVEAVEAEYGKGAPAPAPAPPPPREPSIDLREPAPAPAPEPVLGPEAAANDAAPVVDSIDNERWDDGAAQARTPVQRPRRSLRGVLWAVIVLVLVGAAGYFAWLNMDRVSRYVDLAMSAVMGSGEPDAGSSQQATGGESEGEQVDEGEQSGTSTTKFTQRLTPDGREVDEGPAGGEPTVGEGTSISSPTPQEPASNEQQATDNQDSQETPQPAGETPAVPVGQKAIFYEERTSSLEGSAEPGAVVWSVVQESPGGDFPPEPAIRGDITVPGKGVSLRITFRRNADKTLPASHIIELVFVTPEDFQGGSVDNVLRIAMKGSEEATGNPLIGIPAKIADGFFLVALTDARAEVETNTTLMRRQSWIDIPIAYATGRRALITMEKGVPGDKVFDEVLTAWQKAAEAAAAN